MECHIRALHTAGVQSDHYGALLIPIILERIPDDIKLEMSRRLGTTYWQIDGFMKILKEEISGRENCDFLKNQGRSERSGLGEKNGRNESHFTTEALHSSSKILNCVFCGRNHFNDKCNVVTEVAERKRLAKEKKLCYRCLGSGHTARNCRNKHGCYRCKSIFHHTAICESERRPKSEKADKNNVENAVLTMVNSKTSVLLQTASGIISDTAVAHRQRIKILMDPGSQRTYLSERIVKALKLEPFSSKEMTVKSFGDLAGKTSVFQEYRFCVRNPKRGGAMYLTGFAVPNICAPLQEQRLEIVEKMYPILKKLDLSDVTEGNDEIDLLLGSDYYWTIVEGGVQKFGPDGLTAINSKLGWILNGPYGKNVESTETEVVVTSHVTAVNLIEVSDDVALEVADRKLDEKVENLWNLETLGITEKETSWYEDCLSKFEFVQGRYQVNLPFKDNRRFMEDNYTVAERRLTTLKRKLDKNPDLMTQYDGIMQKQLENGIIERAINEPTIGEVTYLPHQAVLRNDKVTTKVRIVFNCSIRNKGPSLNECLHKGPTMTPLLFDVLLRLRVGKIDLAADISRAYRLCPLIDIF